MDTHFIFLIIIVLLGNISETVTGFGNMIITVTLASHFYSIQYLIVVLMPLNVLITLYIILRHYYAIDYSILFKRIFPIVLPGLLIGIVIFNLSNNEILKIAYGIFVLCISVFELINILRTSENATAKPLSNLQSVFFLFTGGIIQGIYASGGPLVVYYASKKLLNKSVFRSTLQGLWIVTNNVMLINHIITHKTTTATLRVSLMLLPAILFGIIIGEFLHNRVKERTFRILVYSILIAGGASFLILSF